MLGGARSGKSRYAEWLIATYPQPWIYVATAEARDDEMAERIAVHKARRAAGWQTVEASHALADALRAAPTDAAVLVDCLTLWLSNLLEGSFDIEAQTARLLEVLARRTGPTVLVSNEVGLGIVPDNALARRFRDLQGTLNQRLAAQAARVIMMVAGVPVAVKEPMTKPVDDKQVERHRAKMANRKARQDEEVAGKTDREGSADRPYRHRQGQVHGGLRTCVAHARPGQADRRGAVHQGRLAYGERDALEPNSAIRSSWHTMGEGFTWETQDLSRDIAAASAPGARRKS